ncbi:MAG: hypothetical protein IJ190_05565 [Prevotella sp.]|nr:hypothetical protein [Prevotella sp.]
MRWNRFVISIGLLLQTATVAAGDSIDVVNQESDTYRHRVELRQRRWASLIPNQFVIQNAGNMGIVSAGFGWGYGKRRQWETHLLIGYIPKDKSTRGKVTMTLKENYIPWDLHISGPHDSSTGILKRGWTFSPLTASLYINTVYGHEFWKSQPNRYPDKYYEFMSTKFRLNIALGQRITWEIPSNRRKYAKSISLFYELGSCDLYIRAKFLEHSIPLKDIIGLSIGVKLQTL